MEKNSLSQRWSTLDGRKGSLHTRNEKYARWTLPYLYPKNGEEDSGTELDTDLDSVGARAVNHLSNKVINTMFPSYRPFIRLEVSDEVTEKLKAAEVPLDKLDEALAKGEKKSVRLLDKMGHRTTATLATKYLIVTGNALMYYPDDSKAQVYNTRDYCVVRDLSGTVVEIITRDMKAFETFTQEVQQKLIEQGDKDNKYEDGTNVIIYTRIKLEDNGKFKITQAADNVDLDVKSNTYARKDLPWVPLSWNLVRGSDYAHGMVEDYRGAFNAVDILSQSLLEGVISAAAVKFLVNPSSVVDVESMNNSPNGSYHSGRGDDITTVNSDKHLDFQQVRQVLDDYTRQLGQAFLLNSEITRDAERVTAEEIRKDAQELEMAYGGIYSRFTEDWQEPVARLLLSRQEVTVDDSTIYPTIVTGLDTLSRMGDLDNFHMFVNDLALISGLPEPIQQRLKNGELISWIGTNRGLDYSKFIKSDKEVQAEQDAAIAQQQAMQQQEVGGQMVADAGKELAKEVV